MLLCQFERYDVSYIIPQGNHNHFTTDARAYTDIRYIIPQGNHNYNKYSLTRKKDVRYIIL